MTTLPNEYEQAFENWLIDNRVQYVAVDQRKRRVFARSRIKSFDFLLYPSNDSGPVIVEVKGRKFRGSSLAGMTGFDSWVLMEDIRGLIRWEQIFGVTGQGCTERFDSECFTAWFVFAYKFEKVDVENDGSEIYEFDGRQYTFYGVRLDNYREFMRVRSPRWQTVVLPADKFREFAVPVRKLLLG